MAHDLDPRLLRAFVAVAEELHFTRAAARLHIAQQALSRDMRRLEQRLRADLFTRSTRHVALTAEGERLLPHARAVLAAHDELNAAVDRTARPLVVDVAAPVATGHRVLEDARTHAPGVEFVARFVSGLAGAAEQLAAGRLDVSFGRFAGLPPTLRRGLDHGLVRLERLAVLLPADHPLAASPHVPLAALAGETLYAGAGNAETAEWTDYARALFAGRDIRIAPPFPKIEGKDEFVRVVRSRGWSVLASEVFVEVPGMVLRPLVEPVPLSPVSVVWRRGLRHPGLDALLRSAAALGAPERWLDAPPGAWLPAPDRELLGLPAA
ncbi:LysR family transcriptional regulator [Streptomyces alkaliterrae]|uniref:LysR family transcriptional regulator n=1 Tax=Streptomyces alkaliterrae TaxID=2213162 RepID=A0A5P0Z0N0_9ACTN|nr:LysR family transcriptional regulator [Streptomyces alkaliterrae]MBB1262354.1 LysR family transcriptional regulator [Streptomyces alkaliterrae]MQS05149.1 LysR family transcriptional regulator [Streptomyces alkaliterrae]